MKYRTEIIGVWDRARMVAETRHKLEKDLGVAAFGDEKMLAEIAKKERA